MRRLFGFLCVFLHFFSPVYADSLVTDDIVESGSDDVLTDIFNCLDFSRLSSFGRRKSQKMPELGYVDGLLANLEGTSWRLKFHPNTDFEQYSRIGVTFFGSDLFVKVTKKNTNQEEDSKQYTIIPVKMFSPDEGVFAYVAYSSQVFFVYIRLMLSHLLGLQMCSTYEEAKSNKDKSITEIGVFVLE